jgi:hypothetical protein
MVDFTAATPVASAVERNSSYALVRVPGSPDTAKQVLIPDLSQTYLPPQTNLVGSLAVGTGLRSLAHTSGDTGQSNVSLGIGALDDLTTGRLDIAIGYLTGQRMTALTVNNTYGGTNGNAGNVLIGGYVAAVANGLYDSTLIGTQCGLNATTGMDLVGVGINCMKNIEAAGETVGVGHGVFEYLVGAGVIGDIDATTQTPGAGYSWGHRMTGIGDQAARFLNDGSTQKTRGKKSVYVGANTRSGDNWAINENVFGYAAQGRGSNTMQIGGAAVTATHITGLASTTLPGNVYRDPSTHELKQSTGPVFAAWTPTFSATSGTFTTVTVNVARWSQVGKIVYFNVRFTVTTAGSASGSIIFTAPVAAAYLHNHPAFERVAAGVQLRANNCDSTGDISGTLDRILVVDQAAAGNIIASGREFIVTGWYEAT